MEAGHSWGSESASDSEMEAVHSWDLKRDNEMEDGRSRDPASATDSEMEDGPCWGDDIRVCFDPPTFTLNQAEMVRAAVQDPVWLPRYFYTYWILQDFGSRCAHDRAEWYGYPVGPGQDDADLWISFVEMAPELAPLMQAMAVTMASVHVMWRSLMLVAPCKCPSQEHILMDQPEFWILLNALVHAEKDHWH